ncbi:alpha/beta fold hydrolase [Euzebya tangerina]|uniref:alpha/beta fold hydrolase n=1 Tax=Euzebya tangerina TaxID=591198 RepID=UPI0013C2D14B|nr:alpha/beta fold hydrolase [Euzebya tangerina]
MTSTAASSPPSSNHGNPDSMSQATLEAALDALPIGLSPAQSAAAAARVTGVAIRQPKAVVEHTARLWWKQVKTVVGMSETAPDRGDRRFTDEWFSDNPVYKRLAQSYLNWNRQVYALLDDLELDEKSRERARFVLGLITETVAPTNTLLGNPAALKKFVKTRGASLRHGLRHMAYDVRNNGGMPSMVDTRPFALGDTVAATTGGVVFRNDVLELIQYTPQTETVRERPVVFVPPQINKYYILDLAPERSLVEHAVRAGQQVFMVSWRNPDREMRDWDMDTYLSALLEAFAAVTDITGSEDLNMVGVCAGGITAAALLGHLAAIDTPLIKSATFLVTVLDWSVVSTVGTFISRPVVAAAIQKSQRDGVLSGQDLARLFAWMRPNDLVWNYWVNNYLLGNNPSAFDVLSWNVDSTNLPAGLHADFMHMAADNAMTIPGAVEALGTPVDLGDVKVDNYVVGAINDHITPWQGCYQTTQLLGGRSTFVLSNAGHIVAMVNPPGSKKSSFHVNTKIKDQTPEQWKAGATVQDGTWWDHWITWLETRSGEDVAAPSELGNDGHPMILPAPGTYVRA